MKNIFKLITLLTLSTSLCSCNNNINSSSSSSSSGSSSSSDTSSSSSSSSTLAPYDLMIKDFVNGTNVNIPKLEIADYQYDVYYYYQYQQYYFSATCVATQALETAYYNKVLGESTLTNINDDINCPYEEYGYYFMDNENDPLIELQFYFYDGYFVLNVYRNDGKSGNIDTTNIDKSWYVDYVNLYGYELLESFPSDDIKNDLGVDIDIPNPNKEKYIYEASLDEETNVVTVTILVDEDITSSYTEVLTNAEYMVSEGISYTFDDNFDLAEYSVYSAFDKDHKVNLSYYSLDPNFTYLTINKFADIYTDTLTTNTDWTNEEKDKLTSLCGEILPFIQLGEGYLIDDSYLEWFGSITIIDNYYQPLLDNYGQALTNYGFSLITDENDDYYGYYYKDNHIKTLYVGLSYSNGNNIDIYIDNSSYIPATEIHFDVIDMEVVKEATISLNTSLVPENASSEVVYTSSNENIATVDNNGTVTISSEAAVGSEVTITARAEEGVTTSVTFTVAENSPKDIDVVLNADINLGNTYQINASILPYGAIGTLTYASKDETIATVTDTGLVSLTDSAKENDTFIITVSVGDIHKDINFTVKKEPIYRKVTSALADYSGEYLIVYENKALNGALTTLDAENNYIDVAIEDNAIKYTEELHNSSFTIEAYSDGYSIKSQSGYYIGNDTSSNKLSSSQTTKFVNYISFNGEQVDVISNGHHLAFNNASNQLRFRYYKSDSSVQSNISLYRLEA